MSGKNKLKRGAAMKITTALKNYKAKRADVNTTIKRIEAWENALKANNIDKYFTSLQNQIEPGMPRAHSQKSPVESAVLTKESNIKLTREMLKKWIAEDKSRIYFRQIEIEQIDSAMNALTEEDRYIIERKYMDNVCWMFVEISYNEQFRQTLTDGALCKKSNKALRELTEILKHFYSKYSWLLEEKKRTRNDRKKRYPVSVKKL